MTQLETMKLTKRCLEQLERGIDPFSGAHLPEDARACSAELRKCFHYAARDLAALVDHQVTARQWTTVGRPDLLRRHQQEMELLSRDIDPTTGELLPEGDLLSQARMRAHFQIAAGLLGRAADWGRLDARAPFDLPRELWGDIPVSTEPCTTAEFTRGVNAQIPDPSSMRGLTNFAVGRWLQRRGLTAWREGRVVLTDAGRSMGLATQERPTTRGGVTAKVLLSPQVQRMMVERFGELVHLSAH